MGKGIKLETNLGLWFVDPCILQDLIPIKTLYVGNTKLKAVPLQI